MKKNTLLILFIAFPILLSFTLLSDKNELDTTPKIRVFVSWPGGEARPHYYWDKNKSKPEGIEPKLIERVLEIAGLDYEYIYDYKFSGNGDPRIEVITSGIADLSIRGITINPEREREVLFSMPYYIDGLSALINRDSDISSVKDLKGKKIYAHNFTTAHKWSKNNLTESELITHEDGKGQYIEPQTLLLDGKIDAYIIDYSFLKNIERYNPWFKTLKEKFTKEPLGIAVSKNNKILLNKINQALTELKNSGELNELVSGFDK